MEETFARQTDGRLVAGPALDLGPADTGASLGKWVALTVGIALVLAAGVFVGRATVGPPETTWQTLAQERAVEGCLPVFLVQSVAKPEQADQLASTLDNQVSLIKAQYPDAQNIETRILPIAPNGRIAQKYPGVSHIGVVTLERCL